MPDPEVTVVGLGIMGSCTLWQLAARGVSAVGYDRFNVPHAQGASHGHSRMLRRLQFEGDQYVPLADRAYALWRRLEEEAGRRLFTRTGLLIIGPPDSQLIRGARESAERCGLDHELLSAAALRERYPQHRVAEDEIGLLDPAAGFVSPEDAIAAALGRARALGAEIRTGQEVREAREANGRVVIAAGTWLGTLVPELASRITIERHFFAWLPVRDAGLFAPGVFPMWIRESVAATDRAIEDSHAHSQRILAYGFPSTDGARVKIGFPATGVRVESPEVDRRPRPEEAALLTQTSLDSILNGVLAEPSDFSVCLYDNSPDGHFIIGSPPGRPNVTVLGGFSGHGFKHAPAVGEIAAALVTGEDPPVDIRPWSPERL
jgi:sarcosine oxidase